MSQNKPVIPKKKVVWMTCRAGTGCEGNQAFIAMIWRRTILQGGGSTYRYQCTTCNGVWSVTL